MTRRNEFTSLQLQWLEALESGEYQQGREMLRCGSVYCCLGVAEHLIDAESPHLRRVALPDESVDLLHLRDDKGALFQRFEGCRCLAAMNDSSRCTFAQIAAFIREHPWQVFTNFDVPAEISA